MEHLFLYCNHVKALWSAIRSVFGVNMRLQGSVSNFVRIVEDSLLLLS